MTFSYRGIARSELRAATRIGAKAGLSEHRFVRLPDLKEISDITGSRFEGLPPTYIPMRNSVFYSFAGSYAEEIGASAIVGGHNGDDRNVFPDAGPDFFHPFQKALRGGSPLLRKNGLRILRPLGSMSKPHVIRVARSIGVPLELTWSCHRTGAAHCWKCDGCQSRSAAFAVAGVRDPLMGQPEGKLLKG